MMILKSIDVDFLRISNGNRLNLQNEPYSIKYLEELLKTFEEIEDYQKCNVIYKFIESIMDHNDNYKKI